jgi:hypothetical protein
MEAPQTGAKNRVAMHEAMEKFLGPTLADFSFDKAIAPYKEGGPNAQHPVERTWGMVINWLHGKLGFDTETVGAAILLVTLELKNGLVFKGDGSYGSPGNEFDHYLKKVCLRLKERNNEQMVFATMGKKIWTEIEPKITRKIEKRLKPWHKRLFGTKNVIT